MSNNSEDIFKQKVLPIMDKVMKNLRTKQLEEIGEYASDPLNIMAGAMSPDGGMTAPAVDIFTLKLTGKWNSKHTEDYIKMVKDELKKQHISVTPEIEKKMIDKMIKDEIPKSSIDYILRKAATNTLFYLPQALNKSPLENHITKEAEKRYNPSTLEKGTGYVLGAATDYLTMGGIGGSITGAAKFIGVDLAMNVAIEKAEAAEDNDVPLIIAPEHRAEYKASQAKKNDGKPKTAEKPKEKPQKEVQPEKAPEETTEQKQETQEEQPQQTNENGWGGLLSSFGLNGIGDIGNNLGYVLAMLPDFLVGLFTGKSKMNIKDNLLPIASIAAGMFVKNPILKMVLIGMGGLNLINKAGHETLENRKGDAVTNEDSRVSRANYRVYQDEALNPRITNPELRGNSLVAMIDKVPCTIALSERIVDAYNQGALPLNTLANAILAKNDQMRQLAAQNYEAGEQQTVTRTLAQR